MDRSVEQIESPDAHDIENDGIVSPRPEQVIAGLVIRCPVKDQPGVVIQKILQGIQDVWLIVDC